MINWTKFEKMWTDRGEVGTRDLVLMLNSCGNSHQDPFKIMEIVYDRIGIKNILKRRVDGKDLFSINSNAPTVMQWLSFEKEIAGKRLSGSDIVKIANSFGINESFSTIYKRYSKRIVRDHSGGVALFRVEKGIDNQEVESGFMQEDELKGL
jgi:hypothetical protein